MAKVSDTTSSTNARRLATHVALTQLRVDDLLAPSMALAYGVADVQAARAELETLIQQLQKNLEGMGGRPTPRAAFVAMISGGA